MSVNRGGIAAAPLNARYARYGLERSFRRSSVAQEDGVRFIRYNMDF